MIEYFWKLKISTVILYLILVATLLFHINIGPRRIKNKYCRLLDIKNMLQSSDGIDIYGFRLLFCLPVSYLINLEFSFSNKRGFSMPESVHTVTEIPVLPFSCTI